MIDMVAHSAARSTDFSPEFLRKYLLASNVRLRPDVAAGLDVCLAKGTLCISRG
jgi:hypothetical protein